MRSLGTGVVILGLACVSGGGCDGDCGQVAAPRALNAPALPVVEIDAVCRLPTPEEFAEFKITRDEALTLGRNAAEHPSDSHMRYDVTPCMWQGRHVWHVSGTSAIAGGWEAWIDALGGGTWQMRRLPGR